MGGLAAVIRSAVEAAQIGTASLQVEVAHSAWVRQDPLGAGEFDPAVTRTALVQEGAAEHELPGGKVISTKAKLFFLEPIAPNGADGRQEPIDPRDLFTLPSGVTGRAIEVPGVALNPETDPPSPYVRVVWLV